MLVSPFGILLVLLPSSCFTFCNLIWLSELVLGHFLFSASVCYLSNQCSIFQRAGAHDDKGNPVIRDFYSSPLTAR